MSKQPSLWTAVVASLVATGCVSMGQQPVTYTIALSSPRPTVARLAGCPFDVLHVVPSRPFEEIGNLSTDSPFTFDEGLFRDRVSPSVCYDGGDAVIARIDHNGAYVSGTVIRYVSSGAPGAM